MGIPKVLEAVGLRPGLVTGGAPVKLGAGSEVEASEEGGEVIEELRRRVEDLEGQGGWGGWRTRQVS